MSREVGGRSGLGLVRSGVGRNLKKYSLLKNRELKKYIKNIDKLFQNFIETNFQESIVEEICESPKTKQLINSLMKLFTGYKRINYYLVEDI